MVVANIDQINNNNMRMTEVNTYYGEQYKSYIELIKSIIWFSLPILILSILKQKELLPESILNLLIGLILLMGISYTLWIYYDFSRRSNMNFSEYEWDFSKPAKSDDKPSTMVKDENGMKSLSDTLGMGCIGMECCSDGMTYDPVLNKCVSQMGMPVVASSKSTPSIYNNIGCWGDKAERAMPVLEGADPSITGDYKKREDSIVKCYNYAKSKGYKYFGIQDGGHCQGSNNLAEAQKYGPSTVCSNGKGGPWANDVYEIL
jgi:hypothetical protein